MIKQKRKEKKKKARLDFIISRPFVFEDDKSLE
jgi:hypothetical protein